MDDPRLRPLALRPTPAWLWSPDATQVLWANPTGAAIFNAPTPAALAIRSFERTSIAAVEVARVAATLRGDGAVRLERLRGFGAAMGRMLTCACSRIALADGTTAVLIAATEIAGPHLSLQERVSRLLAANVEPLAVFGDDGALIGATAQARRLIGDKRSLDDLAAITGDRVCQPPVWFATLGKRAVEPAAVAAAIPVHTPLIESPPPAGAPPAKPVAHDIPETVQPELFPDLPPVPSPATTPAALEERHHPLRFVWQMDPEGRFTIDSAEFLAIMGPRTAALIGQPWPFIASVTQLDPEGQVARAIATRATFSGVLVAWRIDDSDERLGVELSGLPVFDRDRNFCGYRGFGVCRDIARLNAIAQARQAGTLNPPATSIAASAVQPQDAPGLTPVERYAFDELSRRLTSRINEADARAQQAANTNVPAANTKEPAATPQHPQVVEAPPDAEPPIEDRTRPFLDRLPIGVLVYRLSHLLYANKAFLDWTGSESLDALAEAGGLDSLMIESGDIAIEEGGRKSFRIASFADEKRVAEARLLEVPWDRESAFALLTMPPAEDAVTKAELDAARALAAELTAILDTATDGVIVLDRAARIVSGNRSAQALFGYDATEFEGRSFADLFAPESIGTAIEYMERLQGQGVTALINDGREVIGRERLGGLIPMFMTMGRLGEAGERYCAVFRDVTPWKKAEEELIAARRDAERASSAKSDFLAKISHEIRTPLNAIIGFSEVMTEERFGPIGNDRYRQYLKDIHASGAHLISLLNDLLDLSKIEAGKLELTLTNVSLNDLTQQCVAIMQPPANRERVIIRTSLSPRLPQVMADARSVRQIVLNLLSNSIKFTVAGGQVIVSTAITDRGEVALRVRDTGIGMNEKDLATALEPFRQVATVTRARPGGTGLGLPLTKALAEANHARFNIKSAPNEGTLVEITFPGARLLAAQ
ncbi:MAG: PAS domain S-box protein [Xanthobacteraceae bacterium]|nr:PAS domain S-box protein [Xanthobacteraceae bacterium]